MAKDPTFKEMKDFIISLGDKRNWKEEVNDMNKKQKELRKLLDFWAEFNSMDDIWEIAENVARFISINSDFDEREVTVKVLYYMSVRGDEAVRDLAGFIRFMREQLPEKSPVFIVGNLMHDINGADDKIMLPRTHGYGKFLDEGVTF